MLMTNRVIELRKSKGMSRKAVASELKLDQTTYGKYELGKRQPSVEVLNKISSFFNVSTDYLLGKTDYKYHFNDDGKLVTKIPIDLGTDAKELHYECDDENKPLQGNNQDLEVFFEEPLQSYAIWLRKIGISISAGGKSGKITVLFGDDEGYEITDCVGSILQASKENFKTMVRQFGKPWSK